MRENKKIIPSDISRLFPRIGAANDALCCASDPLLVALRAAPVLRAEAPATGDCLVRELGPVPASDYRSELIATGAAEKDLLVHRGLHQ